MIKQTRRRLDTCDCVVIYEWDNSLPVDQITHSLLVFQNKCDQHSGTFAGISNDQELYDNVICHENGNKNRAYDTILKNAPAALTDLDKDGSLIFRKDVVVSWSWSGVVPNRVMTITVTGYTLNINQKANIQAKLDELFGINNVVFANG